MPKIKTNKGAAKRFKKTAKGKYKRFRAGKGHLLSKKQKKTKRRLRKPTVVTSADKKKVKRLLP